MYQAACRFVLATTISLNSFIVLAEETAESDAGLFSTGLLRGWERELDLGINGSDGNSDSLSIHAGFKADYEDNWKMNMDEGGKLAMKIGLSNEYDSEAADDIEKNDFKYYLALVWGLGPRH